MRTPHLKADDPLSGILGETFTGSYPFDNDNFADSRLIHGLQGSAGGTLDNATQETDEPDLLNLVGSGTGNGNGATVWFHWIAPATADAFFDLAQTPFWGSGLDVRPDTLLGVFTGDALAYLVNIAANDDGGSYSGLRSQFTSAVRFAAVAGTRYRFQVASFNSFTQAHQDGDTGPFVMSWQQVVPNLTEHDTYTGGKPNYASIHGSGIDVSLWTQDTGSLAPEFDSTHMYVPRGRYLVNLAVQFSDGDGTFRSAAINSDGGEAEQIARVPPVSGSDTWLTLTHLTGELPQPSGNAIGFEFDDDATSTFSNIRVEVGLTRL